MKSMNKVTLFLILTFIINYAMAGIFYLAGGELGGIAGTVISVVYMFIPMLTVLIVMKLVHKEDVSKKLKISFKLNYWWLVALIIPFILGGMTLGISLLFPQVQFTPDMQGMMDRYASMLSEEEMEGLRLSLETLPIHPFWLSIIQGLFAGATINAVAAFGEELGWRGFLLHAFRKMSFLKASLIIGFIWGLWHAPLILMGHNYPDHPVWGVAMMTLWCILLTPLFNYITLKSSSVIAASVLHGTINATAGIAILVIAGGSDLLVGITGVAGILALAIVLVGFAIYDIFWSKTPILGKSMTVFWGE